ncbi:DUF2207 domain-containing protein [Sphingomonas antarctica]|uniref:hypothetical protein n=1 Tax=Sphingomonas antarctica TaxID=2040274 RepID=UPI0039EBDAC3
MTETDQAIAHADAILDRQRAVQTRRAYRSRAPRAARNAAIGVAGVALLAFVIGLITPLGITGAMLAVLAMVAAAVIGVMLSAEPHIRLEALPQAPIALLPSKTARWLDQQRPALPAPAQTLADGIGVKLEALQPQLATLDNSTPAAFEIRRLIADELPELVNGYARVPTALRRNGLDGMAPDAQLVDGLKTVDAELTRMSEQLARGDLEKLATQGKYLELKYRGEGSEI